MNQRAYVYVDGFNLYFGIKKYPYKWLDLVKFSELILPKNSNITVEKVKYFTAKLLPLDDPDQPKRQAAYWKALQHINGSTLEIIHGSFRINQKRRRIAHQLANNKWVATSESIDVMQPEEKGTDVNLAVHLVNDAWRNLYDIALVISNDSDLFEGIRIVKNERNKEVYLANPINWKRPYMAAKLSSLNLIPCKIRKWHLVQSQMPVQVPGTNISKPIEWE